MKFLEHTASEWARYASLEVVLIFAVVWTLTPVSALRALLVAGAFLVAAAVVGAASSWLEGLTYPRCPDCGKRHKPTEAEHQALEELPSKLISIDDEHFDFLQRAVETERARRAAAQEES